jgi:hypothetical protein
MDVMYINGQQQQQQHTKSTEKIEEFVAKM